MGRADNEQHLVPFTCQYHHEEVLYLVLLLSIHMWEGRAVDATEVAFVSDREAGVCCQRNHARCDFFVQRLRFSVRRAPQCMPCPRELFFFWPQSDRLPQTRTWGFLFNIFPALLLRSIWASLCPQECVVFWAPVLFSPVLWNAGTENKDYVSRIRQWYDSENTLST